VRALIERYGLAVIGVVLALGLRTVLAPVLEGSPSYLFFVPAILVASALGGWEPGVFASCLGLLSGLFFVADYRALTAADIINAFVFMLVGIGASWRGEFAAPFASCGRRQRPGGAGARDPYEAHPRHHSGRHDRHR
jgi:K+-sensing histidine kinase KdpD